MQNTSSTFSEVTKTRKQFFFLSECQTSLGGIYDDKTKAEAPGAGDAGQSVPPGAASRPPVPPPWENLLCSIFCSGEENPITTNKTWRKTVLSELAASDVHRCQSLIEGRFTHLAEC